MITNPIHQTDISSDLPQLTVNESFCRWLYERIKDLFKTILSWLCCCCYSNNTLERSVIITPAPPTITSQTLTAPAPPASTAPATASQPSVTTPITPGTSTMSSAPIPLTSTTPVISIPAVTSSASPAPTPTVAPASPAPWSDLATYIDALQQRENLPQTPTQRVFVTDQFVIEHCGNSSANERLSIMNQARRFCTQEGYQRIAVPEVRVYNDFLIIQRLPISMHGIKEQIGLYTRYYDAFIETAREFTALLGKVDLGKMIGTCPGPYSDFIRGENIALYDSFTLYLEGGEGRLGLIGLSQFEHRRSLVDWYKPCYYATCFFPNYLDEILETATRADGRISSNERSVLRHLKIITLERFDRIYTSHENHLRSNGIFPNNNPRLISPIIPQRRTAIAQSLIPDLNTAPELQPLLPEIVDIAINTLTHFVGAIDLPNTALSSEQQWIKFVSSRSFVFTREEPPFNTAQAAIHSRFPNQRTDRLLATVLLKGILKELARGGEISYFGEHTCDLRHYFILFC